MVTNSFRANIATAVAPTELLGPRKSEVHEEDLDIKSDLSAYFDWDAFAAERPCSFS